MNIPTQNSRARWPAARASAWYIPAHGTALVPEEKGWFCWIPVVCLAVCPVGYPVAYPNVYPISHPNAYPKAHCI